MISPVDVAIKEIGVKEDLGANLDRNGRIKEYLNKSGWKGGYGVPYCAAFVSYCFIEAGWHIGGLVENSKGKKVPITPGTASCFAMADWLENDPIGIGSKLFKPGDQDILPGDILFLDTKQKGKYNHVGIVEKVVGKNIVTIEGNTTEAGLDKVVDLDKDNNVQSTNDPTNGGVHRRVRMIGKSNISAIGRTVPKTGIVFVPVVKEIDVSVSEAISALRSMTSDQLKGIQIFCNVLKAYESKDGQGSTDGDFGDKTEYACKNVVERYYK